jgi:hypothetical protein
MKKFKRLEGQLKKANDSNKVLMAEVKTLKRKPAPVRSANNEDGPRSDGGGMSVGDSNSDSDIARQSDDSNLLFSSRRVPMLTSMTFTTHT